VRLAIVLITVFILFGSVGHAQTSQNTCPDPENPVTLEQEGFGIVTAQDFSTEEETITFEAARLEYQGWIVRAARLSITGNALSANGVCLETAGARGTTASLEWSTREGAGRIRISDLELLLEPSFALPEALPAGRYRLKAATGFFEGERLRAENAVLDRLNEQSKPIERYRAGQVNLESGRLQASGLAFAGSSVTLAGESATADTDRVTTGPVSGFLGRNSAGGEIAFSAERAILFADGGVRLEGVTLSVFGLEIVSLPSLDVPKGLIQAGAGVTGTGGAGGLGGLDQPFRLSFTDGLNFGVERYRLSARNDLRFSVQIHRLFNVSAAPTVSFALEAADQADRIVLGQPFIVGTGPATVRFRATREPNTGPTFGLNMISGLTVSGPCQSDCDPFVDVLFGYAHSFEVNGFRLRPKLELGSAWQPDLNPDPARPSSLTQSLAVVRASGNAGWTGVFGPINLSFGAALEATGFLPGPNLGLFTVGMNLAARLSVRYTVNGFSVAGSIQLAQPSGVFPIRRYRADPFILGVLNAQWTPILAPLPLGFLGLALEKPRFGLNLSYDFRLGLWQQFQLTLDTDIAVYDGVVLLDHFDQPFQTPVFILSPVARIDLAARLPAASLGANITLFGPGLGYTLGAFLDWRSDGTTGWRFNAGVRFR
jgi:hypothetical protein